MMGSTPAATSSSADILLALISLLADPVASAETLQSLKAELAASDAAAANAVQEQEKLAEIAKETDAKLEAAKYRIVEAERATAAAEKANYDLTLRTKEINKRADYLAEQQAKWEEEKAILLASIASREKACDEWSKKADATMVEAKELKATYESSLVKLRNIVG